MDMRTHGVVAAVLCAVTGSVCAAQDLPEDRWRWQAAIYAYLPAIGGTTIFPSPGTDVSVDAQTIIENLKMTFMGTIEGHRGEWGVFTDLVYVDLGDTRSRTRDITIGGNDLPVDATARLRLDIKATVWTLAGTRRVAGDAASPVNLLAGVRLFDVRQTLDWRLSGNIASVPIAGREGRQSASLSNWDAIVGVKGRYALAPEGRWFLPYHADIGTGESKLTWQLMGGVGYAFGWGDVVGAWRHVDYRMDSGQAIKRMNFSGPTLAAVFHW
jgi:hypothetical protein